jgi:Protein of unknown function (DUF2809)
MLTFNPRYCVLALLLLAVEIAIARYIHTGLIRTFWGDALVVGLLFSALRTFLAFPAKHLALGAFLFACCIETAQSFNLVSLLGLHSQTLFHRVMRIALGATFDWWDYVAYAMGYVLCIWESKRHYTYKSHK